MGDDERDEVRRRIDEADRRLEALTHELERLRDAAADLVHRYSWPTDHRECRPPAPGRGAMRCRKPAR